jgi:hypothetical protein
MAGVEASVEQTEDRAALVERLRKSKETYEEHLWAAGHEAGKQWATEAAEFDELNRLSELRAQLSIHDLPRFFEDGNSAYSAGERLFFVIRPEEDGERDAARDFWKSLDIDGGTDLADKGSFAYGFFKGAIEILDSVEDEL